MVIAIIVMIIITVIISIPKVKLVQDQYIIAMIMMFAMMMIAIILMIIIVVSDIQGGISARTVHHAPFNYWDDYVIICL